MGNTRFQRKISLVARRAGGPIYGTFFNLFEQRAFIPIDSTVLILVERRASNPIGGTVFRLVERRADGSLAKDTVSLLVGRILSPMTCKHVETPTSTHWCEVTGCEERKLLSSGGILEVKVVAGTQRGRKPQLNP